MILPENSIDASLTEIRGRYGNDQDYQSDLERIGLNAHSLRQAVARDMVVEAVLERAVAVSTSTGLTLARVGSPRLGSSGCCGPHGFAQHLFHPERTTAPFK